MNQVTRRAGGPAWKLLLLTAWLAFGQAGAQETPLSTVRGVVETTKGKAVGGFWLIIDNADLGMNYRKDVNPIGQFEFTDVYPGAYIFRISPDSYTIVSPAQIQVQGGRTMTVTVVVAPTPATPKSGENLPPAKPKKPSP
jgi:Carboxypeptidase regulatory-like domain